MFLKLLLKFFIFFFEIVLDGTAWLSSVCVVECNIKLFNKRNPFYKFYLNFWLKKLSLTKIYIVCTITTKPKRVDLRSLAIVAIKLNFIFIILFL